MKNKDQKNSGQQSSEPQSNKIGSEKITDNKLRLIGVACLLLGVVFLLLYFKLSQSADKDQNSPPSAELTDSDSPGEDPANSSRPQIAAQGLAGSVSDSISGASGTPSKLREGTLISDKLKSDILRFQQLYGKAVMTSEEDSEIQELLKNGNLIREVGQMLRNHKIMDESNFTQLQMAGIDFLKQALQSGDEDAVRDTVWEIIRDPLIEDKSISVEDRKAMSMPKAELLYHASALRPDLFPDIDMDLPGPVSQQIWKNVQRRQSDNLEESIEESQKFEKDKGSN